MEVETPSGTWNYQYDAQSQLISWSSPDGVTTKVRKEKCTWMWPIVGGATLKQSFTLTQTLKEITSGISRFPGPFPKCDNVIDRWLTTRIRTVVRCRWVGTNSRMASTTSTSTRVSARKSSNTTRTEPDWDPSRRLRRQAELLLWSRGESYRYALTLTLRTSVY